MYLQWLALPYYPEAASYCSKLPLNPSRRHRSTCGKLFSDVDVRAKEFDRDFCKQADQVQMPNVNFDTTEPGTNRCMECG